LQGQVDALWLIPDASVVSSQSREAFFLFSLNQLIPLVSYDRQHLGLGAAAVIEADYGEMGRQAAELATAILAGTSPEELPAAPPRKFHRQDNQRVLQRLNLPPGGPEQLPAAGKE
jgi:ABC-type uncharacterized transport system substrate-binding protein